MTTYTVEGYRNVDFTSKDGEQITGVSLYLSSPIEENGAGKQVEKFWLKPALMERCYPVPALGDELELYFNRYGKIDDIRIV